MGFYQEKEYELSFKIKLGFILSFFYWKNGHFRMIQILRSNR